MIYVLTPEEMRAADADAGERIGREQLMRNAGERIAQRIRELAPRGGRIVAFAGPGDNGGDAFAAFSELHDSYECTIYASATAKKTPARESAEKRAAQNHVKVQALPQSDDEACAIASGAAVAVDGLFGTGSRLPLEPAFHAAAHALDARRATVLAIDIPSGIDAATGGVADVAVRATETLTLAAPKPGLLLEPAREYAGALWCAEIGIDDATLAAHARAYASLDNDAFLRLAPKRAANSDKRSAGAPLVIAGSRQFPGAAILCALGAARAGAGYVTVATPAPVAAVLRQHLIEQVIIELDDSLSADQTVENILDIARRNSSIAIGPGLGLESRVGEIVRATIERTELPVVADASALFHLAKHLEPLRGRPLVLTPHAGEFARISGKGTIKEGERVTRLREFVVRTGITTLLKGNDTLVDDGKIVSINTTGTNALATAGTGDVLTGIIATLLSQGLSPYDAARAGAYWHGVAGEKAARRRHVGVIARDVIDALADAYPRPTSVSPIQRIF